jgi:hypothetical protein
MKLSFMLLNIFNLPNMFSGASFSSAFALAILSFLCAYFSSMFSSGAYKSTCAAAASLFILSWSYSNILTLA